MDQARAQFRRAMKAMETFEKAQTMQKYALQEILGVQHDLS